MNDWTAGYVSEVEYTHGYFTDLNPQRAVLALANAGYQCPVFETACELGFGQGISANIHAAAGPCAWWGTDFNPSMVAGANELARSSGHGGQWFDQSFAEFCGRTDLPDFDFIGLHGVWSWVSDENRTLLVDFLRRKLRVGGVLYISYNTLPGWSSFVPMRHLMQEHIQQLSAPSQGILQRIEGAIQFASRMKEANPLFMRANQATGLRLDSLKDLPRQYLAHEYFNKDWVPMHFSDMRSWLEPAKLSFVCSSHCHEHVDAMNLTAEQVAFLGEVQDPMFKQSVRDFFVNQHFRRDYWIKGPRPLDPLERAETLNAIRLILVTPAAEVPAKVTGVLGDIHLPEHIYPLIVRLLADHRPRSVGDMYQALKDAPIPYPTLLEAVFVLVGMGHLAVVARDPAAGVPVQRAQKFNAQVAHMARSSDKIKHWASPVTGGGILVNRFDQLFAQAMVAGLATPGDVAAAAWSRLRLLGQGLKKGDEYLPTDEANLAYLTELATTFMPTRWPVLQALQALPGV